ncbi:MAG: methionyl-tRNA formyltransferase [Clostridia bacterium]|nr:methionyl-tRNA formyltransferase [Clostridia bacterium]
MRILFMGSPDFAIPSLSALLDAGENVVGVVTQTDKPKGRGYVLTPPPVKVFAQERGIPVWQPRTLRDEQFDALLKQLDPELIVVVAFGKILPASVLSYPRFGCINVHGSLLPKYRGAAPMQRCLIDGCAETGVTTMFMDEGLDTGDMLLSQAVPIGPDDNFEDIHDSLAAAGADLLIRTVQSLKAGTLVRHKQPEEGVSYAAKIESADCLLDFSWPVQRVHDRIRGLSPFPLAFTRTPDGKLLKAVRSSVYSKDTPTRGPGEIVPSQDGRFLVCCGDGVLELVTVLPEGKGRMPGKDYLRGRKFPEGSRLGAGEQNG